MCPMMTPKHYSEKLIRKICEFNLKQCIFQKQCLYLTALPAPIEFNILKQEMQMSIIALEYNHNISTQFSNLLWNILHITCIC